MGFVVSAAKSVVKAVVGVVSKVAGAIFGFVVGKKPKVEAEPVNNLNKSLEPEAYRKIVLGRVASALDVRFWQVWGNDGSKFDEVIALASHEINSVKELYLENYLAISDTGVVSSRYSGVLSRAYKLGAPNQTALSVGDGTQWGTTATFDHVAHMVLKWIPDEKKLPNGIPSRYTQVIEGAKVYDPRRDSTVPGGSGTHRADDRSTWQYSPLDGNGVPIGRNNALQALWYLLGWEVETKDAGGNPTGEYELICGRGVAPEDINMSTFIAGANACESAAYYTDVVLSADANHTENEDKITCSGLIGRLLDPGGLWSYYANIDDTANIAVELTDDDILDNSAIEWNEYESMQNQYNQVTGKFVNPSATTLFQAFPYPMVTDATYVENLGIKRRKTQDFQQVLDNTLAQRLARLFLNEGQYQGEFSGNFNYRALAAQAWSVVRYTSERFGFVKLFRVYRHEISTMQGVGMTLKEIHPSIWSAGTVANALPTGAGQPGDETAQIVLTGLVTNDLTIDGPGLYPTIIPACRVSWTAPTAKVDRTEIRYRLVGTTYWETTSPVEIGTNTKIIAPLISAGEYEIQARHISVTGVPGSWVAAANFTASNLGNITYEGIVDASESAYWNKITGTGKPDDFADVTAENQAQSIVGQGTGATANSLADLDTVANGKLSGIETGATAGDNFIINGDFKAALSFTSEYHGGDTAGVLVQPGNDPPYYKHTGSTGSSRLYFATGSSAANAYVRVFGGETIYLSAEIKRQLSSGNQVRLYGSFYDDNGSSKGNVYYSVPASSALAVWDIVRGFIVVPANATKAFFWIEFFTSGTTETHMRGYRAARTVRGADLTDENAKVKTIDYNATSSENLLRDPSFNENGKYYKTSGSVAFVNNSTDKFFESSGSGSVNSTTDGNETKLPVRPGATYKLSVEIKNDNSTLLRLNVRPWLANTADGVTVVASTNSVLGSWTTLKGTFTVPTNKNLLEVSVNFFGTGQRFRNLRMSEVEKGATVGATSGSNFYKNNGDLLDDADVVTEEGIASAIVGQGSGATANSLDDLDPTANGKLSGIEANADVTANNQIIITPPNKQTVYRTYDGTIKTNQLPRTIKAGVKQGATNIADAANVSYSATATGGLSVAVDNTATSTKGTITVSKGSSNGAGSVRITVTVDGQAYGPYAVDFETVDDPPPTSSGTGSGGGGSGAKQASDSSIETVPDGAGNVTQLTSAGSGESIFVINVETGDKLKGTGPFTYNRSSLGSASTATKMYAQWRYRVAGSGGAWTSFTGAYIEGTGANKYFNTVEKTTEEFPGSITVTQEKSGLAAGDYEVALFGYAVTTGGTVSNLAVASGTANVKAEP